MEIEKDLMESAPAVLLTSAVLPLTAATAPDVPGISRDSVSDPLCVEPSGRQRVPLPENRGSGSHKGIHGNRTATEEGFALARAQSDPSNRCMSPVRVLHVVVTV